jgi:hypothetical protein
MARTRPTRPADPLRSPALRSPRLLGPWPPAAHACECACGQCLAPPPGAVKEANVRTVKVGEPWIPVQVGDHVWVEEGEYDGCILDLIRIEVGGRRLRRDGQWVSVLEYVCRRTTWPEEIRTRWVSLYRRRSGS